jgi:hypothetical protein
MFLKTSLHIQWKSWAWIFFGLTFHLDHFGICQEYIWGRYAHDHASRTKLIVSRSKNRIKIIYKYFKYIYSRKYNRFLSNTWVYFNFKNLFQKIFKIWSSLRKKTITTKFSCLVRANFISLYWYTIHSY